jgi:hypothetical protein
MDVHSTTEPASLVRQPQATTCGREMGMNWPVLSVVGEFGVVMMTEVRGGPRTPRPSRISDGSWSSRAGAMSSARDSAASLTRKAA